MNEEEEEENKGEILFATKTIVVKDTKEE